MRISFSKALSFTTAFSLVSAATAEAYLAPLSFNEMYAYASQGKLTVLNNAILRGMDINAVNADGDTGICVAIRRNDHLAYTTMRRAGAHPGPRCLDSIDTRQYKRFMNEQKSYEAAFIEDDDNSLWWWIGGAAVVGGVALAAGGGGGGGGEDTPMPAPVPEDPDYHSNKGLGYIAGTSEPSEPETSPYSAVLISAEDDITEVNRQALTLTNNSGMWVTNPDFTYDTVPLADLVNFDDNINSYTKFLQIGMRAHNESEVINDTEQTISLGSGTIGLDAVLNSSAANLGTIEITAQNAAIGMVAGDYSSAGNNGTISMAFSGTATSNSLIGMYADTNAEIVNNGTISSSGDTSFGKITGMQTRLTDYYADFVNTAENAGSIELTASGNDAGAMSLWGMSSWLDKAFISGDKSAENLDQAALLNSGTITLNYSLQASAETGEDAVELANPLTLVAGDGGIVGMHADANTLAANTGDISITVTGDAGETLAAGMQGVRGGDITNSGNITVSAEGSAYGMYAVTGTNGGDAFAGAESTVTNNGIITIEAGETGYGMYSSAAGNLTLNGQIIINGAGYGIFKQNGNVDGKGTITITGTGETGSYGIYAESSNDAGHKVTNAADISMTFAPEDENAEVDEDSPTLPSNYGIFTRNVEIDNSGNITLTQENEKVNQIYGILANSAAVTNSGTVSLNGYGQGIVTQSGSITNSGIVNINQSGIGISATGGSVTNSGAVNLLGRGQGILVNNGDLINNAGGDITVTADNSGSITALQLTASGHRLNNAASVVFVSAANRVTQTATAISGGGNTVTNSGSITIGNANTNFVGAYGILGTNSITNTGSIALFGSGYGIHGKTIDNGGLITMHAELDQAPVYGIYGTSGGSIDNHAQVNIISANAVNNAAVFGLYGNSAEIDNSGDIRIGDSGNLFTNAVGIAATGNDITNSGTVRIYGAGTAIKGENGSITNNADGNITVVTNGSADSFGISLSAGGTLTNLAAVKINRAASYSDGRHISVLFADNADIVNSGSLELGAREENINGNGIETAGGNINNRGTVTVYGDGSAITATGGSITNNAAAYVYGTGSVLAAKNGNITNNAGGTLYIYTDGGADAQGIYATGSNTYTVTNAASVSVIRTDSYSQAASTGNYGIRTDNVSIVNSGDISIGSITGILSNAYGLYAAGNGNVENSGTINLSGAGTAIYAEAGEVRNLVANGLIFIRSDGSADSFGIAVGDDNDNLVTSQNLIRIRAADNKASAKTNIGIKANNVNNSGTIEIGYTTQVIDNATGIDGATIDNSGVIRLYGDKTTAIAAETQVTNNGALDLYGDNAVGIKSTAAGQSIVNQENGTITITGDNGYGIYGNVNNLTNNAAVTVSGSSAIGIYNQSTGTVTNTGAVTITADNKSYAIYAPDGSVVNRGNITVNAKNSYAVYAHEIENHGDILTPANNSGCILYANGANSSITNYGTITGNGTSLNGLYASSSSTFHNEGAITITGSGSWGIRSTSNVSTYNSGTITMKSDNSHGMYITQGTVENEGAIITEGANSTAIYANNVNKLTNTEGGTITVNGDKSYGIQIAGTTELVNSAAITVNGNSGFGIQAAENTVVNNSGTITVNGTNGFGIRATGSANITNTGTIDMNATSATQVSAAIYAEGSATVTNDGDLYISGSDNANIYALYAAGSSEIINNAAIHVDGDTTESNIIGGSGSITNNGSIVADNQTINLTSNMKFGAKALFAAKEIAGTATAAATVVQNNNSDVVVLEDNFRGNTDNLTVVSESYLFDAAYDGKKTTLTRKDFAEVEQNASLAAYLEENYAAGNNTELYNNLKEATDGKELAGKLNGATGRDFVPALAAQSLSLMKDLHRQTNNAWLAADNDERLLAGVSYYDRQNAYGRGISDSDDSAVSFYGLFRNTDNDIWQYGFGLSFTKFDGKFDNDATRDEVIAELMLPMALTTESFDLLGTIYGGYGYGDYKRHAADNRYKGDIKNYYYGVVNELRGKIDSGLFGIVLQPVAEFNVNGVYQRGIDDGALEIRHSNSLSVESGLGLFAEKTFVLDDQNSLRFRVGGTWYHEFNDDYATVKARIAGMDGMFALDPLETEKDRGLISAAGEYKYGAFALYGETAYDTGNGGNWMFNAGLKYAF